MKNNLLVRNIDLKDTSCISFAFPVDDLSRILCLECNDYAIYGFDYIDTAKVYMLHNNLIVFQVQYSDIYKNLDISPQNFIEFYFDRLFKDIFKT